MSVAEHESTVVFASDSFREPLRDFCPIRNRVLPHCKTLLNAESSTR